MLQTHTSAKTFAKKEMSSSPEKLTPHLSLEGLKKNQEQKKKKNRTKHGRNESNLKILNPSERQMKEYDH